MKFAGEPVSDIQIGDCRRRWSRMATVNLRVPVASAGSGGNMGSHASLSGLFTMQIPRIRPSSTSSVEKLPGRAVVGRLD